MQRTNITCPEDRCSENVRVRDLGPERAYPRTNRTSAPLREASEVDRCVAFQRNGERCENSAGADTRVCGQHGGTHAEAARRGFPISTEAYAGRVHTDPAPHVRTIERARPRGREAECPHHGTVSPEGVG